MLLGDRTLVFGGKRRSAQLTYSILIFSRVIFAEQVLMLVPTLGKYIGWKYGQRLGYKPASLAILDVHIGSVTLLTSITTQWA